MKESFRTVVGNFPWRRGPGWWHAWTEAQTLLPVQSLAAPADACVDERRPLPHGRLSPRSLPTAPPSGHTQQGAPVQRWNKEYELINSMRPCRVLYTCDPFITTTIPSMLWFLTWRPFTTYKSKFLAWRPFTYYRHSWWWDRKHYTHILYCKETCQWGKLNTLQSCITHNPPLLVQIR